MPTSQSATAKLITKQFVTVRKRRVVSTARITNVFPITVITMSTHNNNANNKSVQSIDVSSVVVAVSLVWLFEGVIDKAISVLYLPNCKFLIEVPLAGANSIPSDSLFIDRFHRNAIGNWSAIVGFAFSASLFTVLISPSFTLTPWTFGTTTRNTVNTIAHNFAIGDAFPLKSMIREFMSARGTDHITIITCTRALNRLITIRNWIQSKFAFRANHFFSAKFLFLVCKFLSISYRFSGFHTFSFIVLSRFALSATILISVLPADDDAVVLIKLTLFGIVPTHFRWIVSATK